MSWNVSLLAPDVADRPSLGLRAPADEPATGRRPRRGRGDWPGYVCHPGFDDPAVAAEILAETPDPEGQGDEALLSPDQEFRLFRRMNFLLHRAARLDADEAAPLRDEATEIRRRIARANQRLVIAMVKRFGSPGANIHELISEGNLALLQAVERYDFARGFRFSTYASRAIRNHLSRAMSVERRRRGRFLTGQDEVFWAATDHRHPEAGREPALKRLRAGVSGILTRLTERERRVVVARYDLDGGGELSLKQLGDQLGITKERVRQIELAARAKLRAFASEAKLDAMLA